MSAPLFRTASDEKLDESLGSRLCVLYILSIAQGINIMCAARKKLEMGRKKKAKSFTLKARVWSSSGYRTRTDPDGSTLQRVQVYTGRKGGMGRSLSHNAPNLQCTSPDSNSQSLSHCFQHHEDVGDRG